MHKVEKVDLTTLRAELPRGYTSALASRLNITRSAVSQALRGANILHPVVAEAIKLRDQHRHDLDTAAKLLSK
jgi:hypothetical protein